MHSLPLKDTHFFFNGDFSGDVIIKRDSIEMKVPFAELAALVAEAIVRKKVSDLEQMTTSEILGLDPGICNVAGWDKAGWD